MNLPNLHTNFHLLKDAKTFATLINSAVGVKEMVHRIFKGIVPHTNRKNVELDLLKRYTTLFAIRHLIDGGVDPRLSRSSKAFTELSVNLSRIMSDWFIMKESHPEDDETEGNVLKIFIIIVYMIYF